MQLGIGVYLGSVSGAAIAASGASTLLSGETQGLALDFTDDFYAATTGFYGSARIIDTGTPANNYDSTPYGLLTYTSPSLKMTRGPDGLLRFGAHNLCPQSETFDNVAWTVQSITVTANAIAGPDGTLTAFRLVESTTESAHQIFTTLNFTAGVTYRQSFALKKGVGATAPTYVQIAFRISGHNYGGAGVFANFNLDAGTAHNVTNCIATIVPHPLDSSWWLASIESVADTTSALAGGYFAFCNNNASATRSQSYVGATTSDVYISRPHLRRTPSDDTYLATTTAARYALPLEWSTAGVLQGMLVEDARTNLCLYSDDLTNAAWTKSNATAAKTATGPDGVANSASTLTATAANATCLQSITSASAARVTSCYIKRRTGTGNIDMTQDNGTTWATVTVTASWTRVSIAAATVTNPVVGLRIVTSGDAVDIALFDHEVGSFITSPKPTAGATATRAVDTISMALPSGIAGASAYTSYVAWIDSGVTVASSRYVYSVRVGADGVNRLSVVVASNVANAQIVSAGADSLATGTSAVSAAAHKHVLAYDASSGNEAFDGVLKTQDVSITPPVGSLDQMYLGSAGGAFALNCHVRQFMIIPRRRGDGELAGMTTP